MDDYSDVPDKDVRFAVKDKLLHIIFEHEIDAIEMMPKEPGPCIFERRKNVIVMVGHPLLDGGLWKPHHDA